MRARQAKLEQLQRELAPKAGAVARVLSSEDGKVLMEALEAEFFEGDLLGETSEETHYNLGARDVVCYLRELRNFNARRKQ